MTFWETIQRGEYVMFAQALLLIIAVCIWWVRAYKLGRIKRNHTVLIQRLRDHVMEGDTESARQICDSADSPASRILCAGVRHIGQTIPEIRESMGRVKEFEKSRLSRGLRWLAIIAVITPLIGIGGTLVGIIDRLRDLGEMPGGVNVGDVCREIAPTIVTTVSGLGVGVLAIVAYACLESRITGIGRFLDQTSMNFIDMLNEPA